MAEPGIQSKQLGSAISNAVTLLGAFVCVAMVHEVSIAQVVTVTVFVVVFLLATMLFHRLGGSTGWAESPYPRWVSGVLSGAVGGGLAPRAGMDPGICRTRRHRFDHRAGGSRRLPDLGVAAALARTRPVPQQPADRPRRLWSQRLAGLAGTRAVQERFATPVQKTQPECEHTARSRSLAGAGDPNARIWPREKLGLTARMDAFSRTPARLRLRPTRVRSRVGATLGRPLRSPVLTNALRRFAETGDRKGRPYGENSVSRKTWLNCKDGCVLKNASEALPQTDERHGARGVGERP